MIHKVKLVGFPIKTYHYICVLSFGVRDFSFIKDTFFNVVISSPEAPVQPHYAVRSETNQVKHDDYLQQEGKSILQSTSAELFRLQCKYDNYKQIQYFTESTSINHSTILSTLASTMCPSKWVRQCWI